MRVVFSLRGQREANRVDSWWRKNRPAARERFVEELAAVISLLETSGVKLGRLYAIRRRKLVYRVLLEETKHHVYFRRDSVVLMTVLSVWSARRGHGPRL